MKTIPLGKSPLQSTRLAYGCWRLAGTWNPSEVTPEGRAQGKRAVIAAFDVGYRLFDHADIYCRGIAESIFGEALREAPGMRSQMLVATKCGIRFAGDSDAKAPQRYDFSGRHIVWSCEQSLKRMGIETIDLYQLHRPDYLMDPQEVAQAFSQLKAAGKVREFGVSNFRPSQVTALQRACPMPLAVNQVEISLLRLDCFEDGTLDQCLADQMTPLAWSPLAGGALGSGANLDPHSARAGQGAEVLKAVDQIAQERGTTRTVVALAWLMRHPSRIIPIVGSVQVDRIVEAARADSFDLSREEWYRLLRAAQGKALP
jgi:predicted oxidoreductase